MVPDQDIPGLLQSWLAGYQPFGPKRRMSPMVRRLFSWTLPLIHWIPTLALPIWGRDAFACKSYTPRLLCATGIHHNEGILVSWERQWCSFFLAKWTGLPCWQEQESRCSYWTFLASWGLPPTLNNNLFIAQKPCMQEKVARRESPARSLALGRGMESGKQNHSDDIWPGC